MALKIAAICYLSLSEIQTVDPSITEDFIQNNPKDFEKILYELGMDVYNYPVDEQELTHRNRFGNIITCKRWVGNERTDKEWLNTPYSSPEARDKSLNNKILTDLYMARGLVESE